MTTQTPATARAQIQRELELAETSEGYEAAGVADELYRVVAQSILASIEATPTADWTGVWAELVGYVQQARGDGDRIDPADLLAYLRELKHKAVAPVREWMDGIMAKSAHVVSDAASDRAFIDRVAGLRRMKVTLNEDEIWYLYRLAVEDLSTDTPCVIGTESHGKHQRVGSMALAKLSGAHMDLTMPKDGGI
jgi:hypothetical protein